LQYFEETQGHKHQAVYCAQWLPGLGRTFAMPGWGLRHLGIVK